MIHTERDSIPNFVLAGALVMRPYESAGEKVPVGTVLSADDFLAINYTIRRIFVSSQQLMPFYAPKGTPGVKVGDTERHLTHRGAGRYDVVEGVRLNKDALSREEAEALVKSGITPIVAVS